jgi:hypothetical protein
MPRFGHPPELLNDIPKIEISDVRSILLYGLNDIFSAIVWLDFHKVQKKCFNKLEIA